MFVFKPLHTGLMSRIEDDQALNELRKESILGFDTETTGLMPYHGDRPFALIFHAPNKGTYYYYAEVGMYLPQEMKNMIQSYDITWIMHNAKFDMHHIWCDYALLFGGPIYDTMVGARLEYNEHMSYSLDACAARIGLAKDDAVEKYIQENKLWEWQEIPGKKVRRKNKFYAKVPEAIMIPYAMRDAEITYKLYEHQQKRFSQIDGLLPNSPTTSSVMHVEQQLTKAVFDIERGGVRMDPRYCEESVLKCKELEQESLTKFFALTGQEYKASPKLFAKVFEDEMENWSYTEKGNPSFDEKAFKNIKHPAAKEVLKIRNVKSRADFFSGFSFYSDKKDFVHPNFNQAGTTGGRFSSSEPNFQNLTNDDENEEKELMVRKAIVPLNENYCIVSIDYDQQEYRLLLDYAGEMELIKKVLEGADVHQATADMMGSSRKYAKMLNFMLLYGGGAQKLADSLGVSLQEAKKLKDKYFSALPRVQKFIRRVIDTAESRGYVHNWAGRRYWCEKEFAYKMPNRVIQGGGADIMKQAIVAIHEFLKTKRSKIFMTVHDELCFYIHKDELAIVDNLVKIMETVYKPQNGMPLTVSVSHSWKNLAEMKEGYPVREGIRAFPKPEKEVDWKVVQEIDWKAITEDQFWPGMTKEILDLYRTNPKIDDQMRPGLKQAKEENDFLKVLKVYGVALRDVKGYYAIRTEGPRLYGLKKAKDIERWYVLAEVEMSNLKYYCSTVNFDLKDGYTYLVIQKA